MEDISNQVGFVKGPDPDKRASGRTYRLMLETILKACEEPVDQLVLMQHQEAILHTLMMTRAILSPLRDFVEIRHNAREIRFKNGSRILFGIGGTDRNEHYTADRMRGLTFSDIRYDLT